jgi:acyl-CoA dehydrogenase
MRDQGATAKIVFGEVAATAKALGTASRPELQGIGKRLGAALQAWTGATEWLAANAKTGLSGVLAAAVPYLHLASIVCGGWQMGRAALVAAGHLDRSEGDQAFYRAKIATAQFYADQLLPQAQAYAETVKAGDAAIAGMGSELF